MLTSLPGDDETEYRYSFYREKTITVHSIRFVSSPFRQDGDGQRSPVGHLSDDPVASAKLATPARAWVDLKTIQDDGISVPIKENKCL